MKKWLIPVIIIVVAVFGIYQWAVGFNNTAVKLNENVSEAWGNVQTSYQRRNDLIGNLVNTVKGAADFEKSTENTIQTARTRYNEAIKPFNNHVKTFPNSVLAGIFNFEGKPYFDAEAGAEKPVDVQFDFN